MWYISFNELLKISESMNTHSLDHVLSTCYIRQYTAVRWTKRTISPSSALITLPMKPTAPHKMNRFHSPV